MKGGLLDYLIRKNTFTLSLVFVLVILISLVAWFKIPLEIMPKERTPPFLYLEVKSKNKMDPIKQELFFTMPVESSLRTIPNLIELEGKTKKDGASFSLTFRPQTNIDLSIVQLQEVLQDLDAKGILDFKNATVSKSNPESSPIMRISVSGVSNVSNGELILLKEIKPRIEALQGIIKVEVSGLNKITYEFDINTDDINQYGLDPSSVSQSLNFQNKRESLGQLPLISDRIMTGIKGRVITDDFNEVETSVLKSGTSVTVGKIAKIRKVEQKEKFINHKNGSNTIFMEIYTSSTANLFDVKEQIENFFEIIKSEDSDLSSFNFEYIFNKSGDLENAINSVFESLYVAIIITFFVVFLFLRKVKVTFVICMVIPVTILMTIAILFSRGDSLNILTLSGLILSIGLIVDNAIVVTERVIQLKITKSPKKAAVEGARDVAVALLMSTLTTIIIFLPAAFIESGDSFTDMLKSFQAPVIASLVSSYIVALLFVPLGTLLVKEKKQGKEGERSEKYQKIFKWIYDYKKIITIILVLVFYKIGSVVLQIEQTDIDLPMDPFVTLNISFSPETLSSFRKEEFLKLETSLVKNKLKIGYKFMVTSFSPDFTSGSATFYPLDKLKSDNDISMLKKRILLSLKNYKFAPGVYVSSDYNGGDLGKFRESKTIKLAGPKSLVIENELNKLKSELEILDGVDEVKTTRKLKGEKNYVFIPTPGVLEQYSFNLSKLSSAIRSRSQELSIEGLKLDGKEVGAKIRLGDIEKISPKDFMQLKIEISKGKYIALSELGTLKSAYELYGISRKNGLSEGRLSIFFKEGLESFSLNSAISTVDYVMGEFSFSRGYGAPVDDFAQRVEKMQVQGNFVILLSVFLIYLLIASLFESFLVPFAILFTVPLAIIFGIAGLFVLDMTLDPMARLGLIILIGIVVNNAIILIDVITKFKKLGFKRKDAIILGCSSRFKTVMMTATTTILGIAPVAFGEAKIMGIPYSSLGICIISGMLFSTLITLVLLPVVYEFFDDLENKLKDLLGIN